MSDDVDNQTGSSDEAPEGPIAGERLAEARREQQISVLEIAKELHLDEVKVRALERNEFDVLGAPVFAKGYLRKYAQLVGVNSNDVLADYYQLTRSVSMPPVILARPRPRQELSPGPWIAVIVVIILAVTAYWWFTRTVGPDTGQPSEIAAPATDSAPAEPESDVAPAGIDESPEDEPPAADETTVLQPEPQAAEEAPFEVTSSPEIADGQMRMLLTYTGDCWTEISDASGRRLFFGLGKDGRTVELSGAEPFNVLFGNPGSVSVRVNGEEYALPLTNRPDRPMRLTISGS